MGKISLKGVIDMHVHTNPDLRNRAYTDFQLLEAGIRVGARAIVIKTHLGSTVERAYLANQYMEKVYGGKTGFQLYGGIVLNECVGGINPKAVENALKLGGKVVWLPTQSARNHLVKMNQSCENCVEVVRDGKIVPELKTVFSLIRQYNAVLGTAHISPREAMIVTEEAKKAGIDKIVITHPEWWVCDWTMEEQKRIVKDYDVILERCYRQNLGGGQYKSNLPSNLETINEIGYKNIMIDTDGGQVENPHWEFAMAECIEYLEDHKIPEEQIQYMTAELPAKLLGI